MNAEWKFSQVFGDTTSTFDESNEADGVSSIEFDETGNFFAVGDKGGRIILFERDGRKIADSKSENNNNTQGVKRDYKSFYEFQSHEPEFDYLKSLEIEEKINKVRFCKAQNNSHFLLSTNDKTIKLWKVYEKSIRQVVNFNRANPNSVAPLPSSVLKVPTVHVQDKALSAQSRRVFANAHAYHINSVSLNSDGETFISSDDLRINLWNLSISGESFNIVDIKPTNMEDLTEVITTSEFHPTSCNLFIYSTSKGIIRMADMRSSALCDRHAKKFEESDEVMQKSFFSEIISSVSDVKFSRDGRFIVSRDYMTMKLWDLRKEDKPCKVIQVHDYLKPKLCDLYENDCIFDKFECAISRDGSMVATGSYHNYLYLHSREGPEEARLEASIYNKKSVVMKSSKVTDPDPDALRYEKKALHLAWHPYENLIAVGSNNSLYLFTA